MKLKIKDIAKLANVSIASVSLALNNKPGISYETREKILKIAQQEGYFNKPSIPAKNKVVRFVACTSPGIVIEQYETLPFFTELIKYIGEYLSLKGYSLMISTINSENLENEINQFTEDNACNGILLLGTDLTKKQITFIAEHQPNVVVLDTCFETLNIDFVNMNSTLGAYQAGKHFIELGHRRIGYVQSNVRIRNFDLRKEGFLMALKENNLSILEKDYFSVMPTTLSSQEQLKQNILKCGDDLPTALFCESDYIAISLVKSLTELGIKVPADISVIGFDDIPECKVINPELTTIQVQKRKMASLAVDRIIELMEITPNEKIKFVVDTVLISRNSCIKK
ncbi:LacI family transcriptional regulator [Peribacillus simplex]|uniref:LacI family transcriptional regulator n=1 Tax=Peribacillus simplex TaxID=1478 RepID=A0A8B5Y433_9BACI|nr:LacI family DNA-binding transcriptional regulator [Peribacillus simplex]TVX83846.1 LacI family transcriptional regulator [Peribacillus simplex]